MSTNHFWGVFRMILGRDKSNYIESEAEFRFELQGNSDIDADVLASILQDTVDVAKKVCENEDDKFLKLKVSRFETGSFDIVFQAIVHQAPTLLTLTPELVEAAAVSVSALVGIVGLFKHIGGKKPTKVKIDGNNNIVNITNSQGEDATFNKNTYNIYVNNPAIEEHLLSIVDSVKKDTDRPGFTVKTEDKAVTFERESFSEFKPVVPDLNDEESDMVTSESEAELIIRKAILDGNTKWGFTSDKKFDAEITDHDWLQKVHDGEIKFFTGMKIRARVTVETKVDRNKNPIKSTYTVTKVISYQSDDGTEQMVIDI